jgi:hypothetical protein
VGVPAALGMGVMEVQIRDLRPEPILILRPAGEGVDGPVVQDNPVPTYPPADSQLFRPQAISDSGSQILVVALPLGRGCTTIAARG